MPDKKDKKDKKEKGKKKLDEVANAFFQACETGKGKEACAPFLAPGATFACQSDALKEVRTLEAYTEWMKGLAVGISTDSSFEVHAAGKDKERNKYFFFATFRGTNNADKGPVPATGLKVESHYCYVLTFNDHNLITDMVKIWNDRQAFVQWGWAK